MFNKMVAMVDGAIKKTYNPIIILIHTKCMLIGTRDMVRYSITHLHPPSNTHIVHVSEMISLFCYCCL